MNPAALCELDTIDADQAVSVAVIRSVAAPLQALAAEWEPAPMSQFVGRKTPRRVGALSDDRQPGAGEPTTPASASVETHGVSPGDRAGVAVASARSDRLLAVAAALTLAPLFPLLARGGWG